MKNAVFWDVTPFGSCKSRRFEGNYRLHYQSERNERTRIFLSHTVSVSSQRASAASYGQCCYWLTDSLHPNDGWDTFLRNVGSYKSHTASHPRRRYSSETLLEFVRIRRTVKLLSIPRKKERKKERNRSICVRFKVFTA
jgi:hypothetical protein